MNDDDSITCNGGNVCTNADSQQVKARRVRCVDDAIRERDLSQREAAAVLDVVGPELSDIPSGRVRGCFAKRLLPILATLDREASIVAAEKSGDDALQQVEAKKRRAVPVFRDIAPLICSAPRGRRGVVAGQKIHYPLERELSGFACRRWRSSFLHNAPSRRMVTGSAAADRRRGTRRARPPHRLAARLARSIAAPGRRRGTIRLL